MKYGFIGAGNMGRALAAALIGKKVCSPSELLLVDPQPASRQAAAALGCVVQAEMEAQGPGVADAQVLLLAVKPQDAPAMLGQLRPLLHKEQVVVSIMAGITMAALQEGLAHQALVRVMPNTPAQVGLGMSVYFTAPAIPAPGLAAVETLFNASGVALRVHTEDGIDAATAISGSGPAYVFYLAEHWMGQARQLGFTEQEASLLVQQTLLGATELWKTGGVAVSTLREQVTSKGGTTAAALQVFEQHALGSHLAAGIAKAYQRSKELGR